MNETENMIPCDDGLHLIQLDENISHYGWVFRKVEGGWPYSVRKATPHEMAHAKARQHLRKGAEQIAAQWQPPAQRLIQLQQDRTKRVYIAGPMTGLPEFNFPAFNAMAATMRAEGWRVENPAEHGIVDGAEWADYLRYDIGLLATCEAVMLLPGWSKSRGACLEVSIARQLDMPIMLAEGAEAAEQHQSAPVEQDERAEFEKWYLAEYYEGDAQCGLEWLSTEPCGGYRYSEPARHWKAWQARAALERKA